MGKTPEFRPLPPQIRGVRVSRGEDYASFYCQVLTLKEKNKFVQFYVKLNQKLSNRTKGRLIASVCGHFLDKRMPVHKKGQIFPSFKVLLYKTDWVKVKQLLHYGAGVIYER